MRPNLAKPNNPSRLRPTKYRLLFCVGVAICLTSCVHPPTGGNPPPCEDPPPEGVEAFASVMMVESIPLEMRNRLETLVATYVRSCEAIDAYRNDD